MRSFAPHLPNKDSALLISLCLFGLVLMPVAAGSFSGTPDEPGEMWPQPVALLDRLRTTPQAGPPDSDIPISDPVLPYSARVAFVEDNTGPNGLILGRDPMTGAPIYHHDGPVRSGNGTADDPFLIEDEEWTLLRIKGTDAHIVLENNSLGSFNTVALLLAEGGDPPANFVFEEVQNVRIRNNTLERGYGMLVKGSSDVSIHGNTIDLVLGGAFGVQVIDSHRVDLSGNEIRHMPVGSILVRSSEDVRIRDNTLSGDHAVMVQDTPATKIIGNEFVAYRNMGAYFGILLDRAPQTQIIDNDYSIEYYYFGPEAYGGPNLYADVGIRWSPDTVLRGNAFTGPGVWIFGDAAEHYRHDIDTSNTLSDGRVIFYHHGAGPVLMPADTGQVILANVSGVTLDGTAVGGAVTGLHLAYADDVTVRGVHAADVRWGVLVEFSEDVRIRDTTVLGTESGGTGIPLGSDERLRDLTSSYIGNAGLLLWEVERVEVTGLNTQGNAHAVDIGRSVDVEVRDVGPDSSPWGIFVTASSDVRLRDMTFSGSWNPIVLDTTSHAHLENLTLDACATTCLVTTDVDNSTFTRIDAFPDIAEGAWGFALLYSNDNLVTDVELRGGQTGLHVDGARNLVRSVTIAEFATGVLFPQNNGEGNRLEKSAIRDNGIGIHTEALCTLCTMGSVPVLTENNIHGNSAWGLQSRGRYLGGNDAVDYTLAPLLPLAPAVDARGNWWGCATGPTTDGCDGVRGVAQVSPWRAEPNPDAGAH